MRDVADETDAEELARFVRQLRLTCDRLRSAGLPRLQRSTPPGLSGGGDPTNQLSPAERAYRLSVDLLEATGWVRAAAGMLPGRGCDAELPRLAAHAAGDQLWVIGAEYAQVVTASASETVEAGSAVAVRGRPAPAAFSARLLALRRDI